MERYTIKEAYFHPNDMMGDRHNFVIYEDPRPDPKDDAERESILGKVEKDLIKHLKTKVSLSFGTFTLLETRDFYNKVTTSDKRLLVGKWLEACVGRDDKRLFDQKKILDFLQWPFKCPGCQRERLSDGFAYNKFTLDVPEDGVSEPVLRSRACCTGCPALRTSA